MKKIIQEITLSEKAKFCEGKDAWHLADLPRLNIRSIRVSDGPHGLRRQVSSTDNLIGTDTLPATCFPSSASTSCSMNPELLQKIGAAIGREARQEKVDIALGPGVNIKRSPLCGRNFEYFSEDPWLSGHLGTAFVKGMQSVGVGSCVKHYAVNNQESYRFSIDAVVDERALHEIYLKAFQMIVKNEPPLAMMAAYNRVNGSYACQHPDLLRDILRTQWNYKGLVLSDWGAISDLVAAVDMGLDVEMPFGYERGTKNIIQAVEKGELPESVLDGVMERVLKTIDTLEKNQAKVKHSSIDWEAHHLLAKEAALESMVLLKNDMHALPLSPQIHYGVIGELAKTPRIQGGGSSHVQAKQISVPLEEMRKRSPDIEYAPGYELQGTSNPQLLQEALKLAKRVDQVILFLGLTDYDENEGVDRKHLRLANAQLELLAELKRIGIRPIVLLGGGSVVEMPWYDDVEAILHLNLLGEAGAEALVEILWGDVSPSGKLTETYPMRLEDTPCYQTFPGGNRATHYLESIYVGYRYYDSFDKPVRFPFGYGLSYSTFTYHDLAVEPQDDGSVIVRFTLKNIGKICAKESAQIYVRSLKTSPLFRPYQELKGVLKVELQPMEEKRLEWRLQQDDFSYFDVQTKRFEVEQGLYVIAVGGSSRDCPLVGEVYQKGTIVNVPDYRQACSSYYQGSQGFDDREYVALLGSIPTIENETIHTIDYDTPFSQWQDRFIGRIIYRVAVKEIKKASEKDSISPHEATIEALQYTPLRFFVTMGGGVLSYELADILLAILNGHYLQVFPLLRRMRQAKKEK